MDRLSVVILTKNEERNIARAIKSVKEIADEILVIDSGSTDRTVEIAKELGARVIFRDFTNYPDQVSFAISKTNNKWVFVLDADEEVSEELKRSIKETLKFPKHDCYVVNRRTYFMGKFLNHTLYPEWRIRVFKKDKVKYEGELHEVVKCSGSIGKLKGDLYHYSFKNLDEFFSKNLKYSKISAEILYKNGRIVKNYELFTRPVWTFFKFFIMKRGFLDGWRGFLISASYAFFNFTKYAYLKELQITKNKLR
ncbi:glycosyltransferase family 2 protein [Aquifex aeolicus]|uniref:Beta 1,4 glucosyltransferase n=1 Tax=Aquifex aeolicus (strain VF5) TaxID=224324 RepID=O67628_AQUAE|nr:glycosyltransferase family 2 protein [Aquifex aeolicus]AAC07593.1 beta 1,4 glucosyltransferase [Aquifex aeolicus VF5]